MAQYSCSIEGCGVSFEKEEDLLRHEVEVHGIESEVKHTCCGVDYYTDEGFKEHQETVHAKKE